MGNLELPAELRFNGLNGSTGSYLLPPLTVKDISRIAQGEKLDPLHVKELEKRHTTRGIRNLGVVAGVNPNDLAEAGWGVIFAFADPHVDKVRDALRPLLEHRKAQANKIKERYYEFVREKAYRPDESKPNFLGRHKVGSGPADPDKVPYYLLIVGDPALIPFRFQYQLDVQYAVGRIHFETLEEYAQYAASVVAAETSQVAKSKTATFFGVHNVDDPATTTSSSDLIKPLAEWLTNNPSAKGWKVNTVFEAEANKARLGKLLGGDETPALLFTASHGIGFNNGDPRQLPHQGALVCADWPGPQKWKEAIPPTFYFSADDVSTKAKLKGLIAFHFACYGAGTPQMDDFAHQAFQQPSAIAPHPFVAKLPRRLLGHPNGGALAVIGHVERAWTYSFFSPGAGPQLAVFQSILKCLLDGFTVGAALEFFNERYAEIASDLNVELEDIKFGKPADDLSVASLWTATNDARSYVIIGDPAVRLV
jgi:hypothetical protein